MQKYDVIVAGAGIGGICGAIAAARLGLRVALIEKEGVIGGTGVHSPVGLICHFRNSELKPIVRGLHEVFFPEGYGIRGDFTEDDTVPTYNEDVLLVRYHEALKKYPNIELVTGFKIDNVQSSGRRIISVCSSDHPSKIFTGDVFLEGTADGNLAALAGAKYMKGRESDGKHQNATLTFSMMGVNVSKLQNPDIHTWGGIRSLWRELTPYFKRAQERKQTANRRKDILCFPYPNSSDLLFNNVSMIGVDATQEETVDRGRKEGFRMIDELVEAISYHPAMHGSKVRKISAKLGIRDSRRIDGEYVLNEDECLKGVKFSDMVAASAYPVDIHDPDRVEIEGEGLTWIKAPGYFHVPYRALIAKDFNNLLLSSRCMSGSFAAHGSFRVMSSLSAIAEAAGTAAGLYCLQEKNNVRAVEPSHIRYVLRYYNQFVEGSMKKPLGIILK